jgi:hypothetical protein
MKNNRNICSTNELSIATRKLKRIASIQKLPDDGFASAARAETAKIRDLNQRKESTGGPIK